LGAHGETALCQCVRHRVQPHVLLCSAGGAMAAAAATAATATAIATIDCVHGGGYFGRHCTIKVAACGRVDDGRLTRRSRVSCFASGGREAKVSER
jgi:hypothetical protein